jgi:hypothetical protein
MHAGDDASGAATVVDGLGAWLGGASGADGAVAYGALHVFAGLVGDVRGA